MKKFLLILILLFFISGCSSSNNIDYQINAEIDAVLNNNNYIIVDVRTEEEYLEKHIIDAINIPLDTMNEDIDLDISKDILVYCKSGARSLKAYTILTELGYNVYNLGGIDQIDLPKE